MRKDFERWCLALFPKGTSWEFDMDNSKYLDIEVNNAWLRWQKNYDLNWAI